MFRWTLRQAWSFIRRYTDRMKRQEQRISRASRGESGSVQDLARFFSG